MKIEMREIATEEDAERAIASSKDGSLLVYKHSPICSLSLEAIREVRAFLKSPGGSGVPVFKVDVIAARPASRRIEELAGIRHESPQVLFFAGGTCIWNASHQRITAETLAAQIASL